MLSLIAATVLAGPWTRFGLGDPVRVGADGGSIDVTHGHAHPLFVDFDGDGKPDLLVGQFQDGMLRVYANQGTAQDPQFGDFKWFQASGVDARVSYG